MKIAAATYPPEWHADWTALTAKLEAWVSDAVGQGGTVAHAVGYRVAGQLRQPLTIFSGDHRSPVRSSAGS